MVDIKHDDADAVMSGIVLDTRDGDVKIAAFLLGGGAPTRGQGQREGKKGDRNEKRPHASGELAESHSC
jgi:hypothetical protein